MSLLLPPILLLGFVAMLATLLSPVHSRLDDDVDHRKMDKEKLFPCGAGKMNHTHLLTYRSFIDEHDAWLDLGETCNLTEKVIKYQEALELFTKDQAEQKKYDEDQTELEDSQLHDICNAMFDLIEEGPLICNSSALLYCKPIDTDDTGNKNASEMGICQCLEEFEEDNYGFKDLKATKCVLKGGIINSL